MKSSEIKQGETYLFVATDSEARKHLEGEAFTVTEIKAVFRKFKRKGTRKVKRYFNEAGEGARAEELEPLPEREDPCDSCWLGEMIHVGSTPRANEMAMNYECNKCGATKSFP